MALPSLRIRIGQVQQRIRLQVYVTLLKIEDGIKPLQDLVA